MFTTSNDQLIRVKLKVLRETKPAMERGRSPRGETEYLEFDLTVISPYILATWTDFAFARKAEQRDSLSESVGGEWEVNEWLIERVKEALKAFDATRFPDRELGTGDMVQFSSRPAMWFLLGAYEDSASPFHTIPYRKYNLLRADKT